MDAHSRTVTEWGQGAYSSLQETPSQTYGASRAVWDHTVLPATQHR